MYFFAHQNNNDIDINKRFSYFKITVDNVANAMEPVHTRCDADSDVQLSLESELRILLRLVNEALEVAPGHVLRDDHDGVRRRTEEQHHVGVVHLLHHVDLLLELLQLLGRQPPDLRHLHRPLPPAAPALVHGAVHALAQAVPLGVVLDLVGADVGGALLLDLAAEDPLLDLLDGGERLMRDFHALGGAAGDVLLDGTGVLAHLLEDGLGGFTLDPGISVYVIYLFF